jgi:hypothetical protein
MRKDRPALFRGRYFAADIIVLCVRWYLRFSLSYRDLKELMAERGLCVDHTTIWRWVQRYAPELNRRVRRELKRTVTSRRVDETYLRVAGRWCPSRFSTFSRNDAVPRMRGRCDGRPGGTPYNGPMSLTRPDVSEGPTIHFDRPPAGALAPHLIRFPVWARHSVGRVQSRRAMGSGGLLNFHPERCGDVDAWVDAWEMRWRPRRYTAILLAATGGRTSDAGALRAMLGRWRCCRYRRDSRWWSSPQRNRPYQGAGRGEVAETGRKIGQFRQLLVRMANRRECSR